MKSISEIPRRDAQTVVVVKKLRAFMDERRITQKRMAARIGITQGTLSRILSGETEELRASTLQQIAAALETDVEALLSQTLGHIPRNLPDTNEAKFDVFLSYTGHDKSVAHDLTDALRDEGISVMLDDDHLFPGRSWHQCLEAAIQTSRTIIVAVGGDKIGPWHNAEMRALLVDAIGNKKAVLPVLLPGCPSPADLPLFLKNRTWVDLRSGLNEEGLAKIIWGIRGDRQPLRSVSLTGDNSTSLNRDTSVSLPEVYETSHRKNQVFVIMPSGGQGEYSHGIKEADFIFENIIQPAVKKGFNTPVEVVRATDKRGSGTINKDVIARMTTCDLAIIDITGQNPNVFFELGIRYSLRKQTTILLRQTGVTVPFDIHGLPCVSYSPFSQDAAIRDITKTIEASQIAVSGLGTFPQSAGRGISEVKPDRRLHDDGIMPWSEYWCKLNEISQIIKSHHANGNYVPRMLLGISNGGMMFADLLARQIFPSIPVAGLWADRRNQNLFENAINRQLLVAVKNTIGTGELLLVQDIVATGVTVKQAINLIREVVPDASLSFLPMFNRNEQCLESVKDILLWLKPPFSATLKEAKKISCTNQTMLPYEKDIR